MALLSRVKQCQYTSLQRTVLDLARSNLVFPPSEQRSLRELRVAVGISGGVDSFVSAWILKQLGCDVTGIHLVNWNQRDGDGQAQPRQFEWCVESEIGDFHRICDVLELDERKILDYSPDYWTDVFVPMLDSFESGVLTPNPDVECARHLQFGRVQRDLIREHGFDYVSTGHFAQVRWMDERTPLLCECADSSQDQTYWLCQIDPTSLSHHLLPLSALLKNVHVRPLARELCARIGNKRSSKGLCFVGARHFTHFLREHLDPYSEGCQSGSVEGPTGTAIPNLAHRGLAYYTIGQRIPSSGIHGSEWNTRKMYVCGKDVRRNVLLVGHSDDPRLFCDHILTELSRVHWLSESHRSRFISDGRLSGKSRCRLPSPQVATEMTRERHSDRVRFQFEGPTVRAVTDGQFLVMTDERSRVVICSVRIQQATKLA